MKNTLTYKVVFGCVCTLFCIPLSAQRTNVPGSKNANGYEAHKRAENYHELKNLGYRDSEIFEDLGNASFLAQNYGTALFWYDKLQAISDAPALSAGFQKRYQYAKAQENNSDRSNDLDHKDWLAMVKADYSTERITPDRVLAPSNGKYRPLNLQPNRDETMDGIVHYGKTEAFGLEPINGKKPYGQNTYTAPVALTSDGNTAYYSKAVQVKPVYGIFSEKELVHKIYKAEKIDGEWETVREMNICPKNFSALHPTVSDDGTRLFFASNMPGTYGEYDIYVVSIYPDGTHGTAKNLGEKVNTKKNELYPNVVGGNTLFFASEGRKGYGGLDVYMSQVGQRIVGLAVNLGSPINSMEDDYSIFLKTEKGMGYVMSNRGKDKDTIQQVAFSYARIDPNAINEKRDYTILEALNSGLKIDYSSSVFEDQ